MSNDRKQLAERPQKPARTGFRWFLFDLLPPLLSTLLLVFGLIYLGKLPEDARTHIVGIGFIVAFGLAVVCLVFWIVKNTGEALSTISGFVGLGIVGGILYMLYRLASNMFAAIGSWVVEFWPRLLALIVLAIVIFAINRKHKA